MGKIVSYWVRISGRAIKGASAFANNWQWAYGAPAFAGIIWLANSWLGEDAMTFSQNALGMLGAGFAAFIITWLVKLLIGLIAEPAKLDAELRSRLERKDEAIRKAIDAKASVTRLIALRDEGRSIYERKFGSELMQDQELWARDLDLWRQEVERELETSWSDGELLRFRAADGYSTYARDGGRDHLDEKTQRLMQLYTAKISALKEMLDYGASIFLGSRLALLNALEISPGEAERNESDVTRQIPQP